MTDATAYARATADAGADPAPVDDWTRTSSGDPRGYIDAHALEELWFHTGTACNLACPFCLEGSKPGDNRLQRVTLGDVRPLLDDACALGVQQFSFTGGEPFIVRDMVRILEHAASLRPCLVLTNGTLPVLRRLRQIERLRDCAHPVAFRVSIDWPDRARHDAGRGQGQFDLAWQGLLALHERGFRVSLARQSEQGEDAAAVDAAFHALCTRYGLPEDMRIVSFPDFGNPGCRRDVPEITELTWLLTCVTAKGLMNRAHAYKAAVADNETVGEDADFGVNMGLFCYPVLMAADILMFNAQRVPVGRDQLQHLEMARDIAQRFNHRYGELLTLPEAVIDEHVATLPGSDGRKMSKSYDNTIPLWLPEKALRKAIMKINTNSLEPGQPKDPDDSAIYAVYAAFANAAERQAMRQAFAEGIAWGEVKQTVFERINAELAEPRERYQALISAPDEVESILQQGAARATALSRPHIQRLREAVGIRSLR